MHRYLIVANRTLTGSHLVTEARARAALGACQFHVVVPLHHSDEGLVWTEGRARALARARLDDAIAQLHQAGLDVTGDLGDDNPLQAVADALRNQHFDEIIVSTLPPGISRWLRLDLPTRLRRNVSIPVTHVIATAEFAR